MNARNWLPRQAVSRPAVRAAIATVVDDWSTRWFAAGRARLSQLRVAPLPPQGPDAWPGWTRHGVFHSRLTPPGEARLIELALDFGAAPSRKSGPDRTLLQEFCRRAVADLVSALEQRLAAAETHASEAQTGDVVLELTDLEGGRILSISTPVSAFADLVRASLPQSERQLVLTRRAEALAPTPITLEAHAGRATVTIAELNGLASGDVLVLDRRLKEGIALRLADAQAILLVGDLCAQEGCAALAITSPKPM